MSAFIINMLRGMITKEILTTILRDVFLEAAMDIVTDFAKKSNNPYDDVLVAKFRAYLDSTK